MIEAVIVGAGQGRRMGGGLPKVLRPLGDCPVILHSVRTFSRLPEIDSIILVVPPGYEAEVEQACRQFHCAQRVRAIVPGGARRQDSVAAGCAHCSPETSLVLIHDAARPRVRPEIIRRVVEAAQAQGAAIPGVLVADTLKYINEATRVERTLDRDRIRAVQTPQGFRRDILENILAEAKNSGRLATDEACLAETLGIPVTVVEGDPENFKLTTPWDFKLAQWLEEAAQ
jgi:2-C-methyl-D-erythritol 4-phosphate cytidylyltransferase